MPSASIIMGFVQFCTSAETSSFVWRLSPRPHPTSTAEDFSACSSSAGIAPDENVPASFDGKGISNDSVSFGAIAL